MTPLTAQDAPVVAALLSAQRPEYLAHFRPFEFDETTLASTFASAERDRFWALYDDGKIVGFAMLRGFDAGYMRPSYGVFVAEHAAGRGLARASLRDALDWCRREGVARVLIKVAPQNERARKVYAAEGFSFTGVCPTTGHEMLEKALRTFIIAEAGVNHNGSLDVARKLVLAAKEAGADAVKFQTFKAERVAQATAPKADYQLRNTDRSESQIEMLRKLELPDAAHAELIALCREVGIEFLSTPYNEEDIDFLHGLGVRAFKLASIHCVEPHILRYAARTGRHLIVSTGMATLEEVRTAVDAMRGVGHEDFTLLQCTTNYPSAVEDANLRVIPLLRSEFNCAVGYSDHTQSDVSSIAAVALGATMIEKHFTLDKSMPGPDHTSAAEPAEFAALVKKIRVAESALGSGVKEPCAAEMANTANMRRSLVARADIARGEVITEAMLTCRRPASGIRPLRVGEIVGRTAATDIAAGTQLSSDLIS